MNDLGTYHHRRLDCGVDFAAVELAGRRTAAFEIRVLAGLVDEPDDRLGLARVVLETITKGTKQRDAQAMSDALDAIGAQCGQSVGRESMVFSCNCLPEYAEQALALHAEMLRTPTFPEDFCQVAVDLGTQELAALEDDPQELCRRLIGPAIQQRVLHSRRSRGPLLAPRGPDLDLPLSAALSDRLKGP